MGASPQRQVIAGVLLVCALLGCTGAVDAQSRPVAVELFTSEGCSSCPPAEAYLGELAQRPEVLALAYHVDYWDDLGWHDRFGLPQAVQRQRAYARALGLSSVYTPQAVVDGQGNFTGSDRRSIAKALEKPRSGVPISLSTSGGEVVVGLLAMVRVAP